MFGDNELALASRFFTFFKIDVESIASAEDAKRYAPKLPAFVLLDAAGNEVMSRTGAASPAQLVGALDRAFKASYQENLAARLRALEKILDETEKVEDALAGQTVDLVQIEERLAKRDKASLREDVEAAKAKIDELKAKLAALEKERNALVRMEGSEPRGDAAAR